MARGRKKKILSPAAVVRGKKFPPVLYGLEGIMRLFGVSKSTASRYKNTILKDGVSQQGHVVVVDTAECLRIFGSLHPENLVDNKQTRAK